MSGDWQIDPLDFFQHPALLGTWFQPMDSRRAWWTIARSLLGQKILGEDLDLYRQISGREVPPVAPAREGWLVVGRRGGKSSFVAGLGLALAMGRDYSRIVKPGETAQVQLLAQHRDAAARLLSYCEGMISGSPTLAAEVEHRTQDFIRFRSGVELAVATSNFRSARGATVVAAILDEVAFWPNDNSANPDLEVLRAIKPAMLTVPNSILIGLSSPYAKRGLLWDRYRKHFGQPVDRVQVFQASTLTMNPLADRAEIEAATLEDPEAARSEFQAQFRDDISSFIDETLLAPATRNSPLELPPREGLRYSAFVDPSGGRGDAMTLAIAHVEGDRLVIDLCRGVRPPFDPAAVVAEFVRVLREYRIWWVTSDHYGAEWVKSAFAEHSVALDNCPVPRSGLYTELLPMLTQGRIELPPLPILASELRGLERRTGRGRDQIDHQSGGHDDHANSVAGAAFVARQTARAVLPRVLAL